jgi:hypothetical protein
MTGEGNVAIGERALEQVLLTISARMGIEKIEGFLSEPFSYEEYFENHLRCFKKKKYPLNLNVKEPFSPQRKDEEDHYGIGIWKLFVI